MLIGYARSSTVEQVAGFDAQLRELAAVGCEKIFSEKVSSVDHEGRKEFATALEFIREDDVLVVTKLDRMARNTRHALEIVDRVQAKGASLRVLNLNLDTATPTGKMLLTMLAAVGEFERAIMLERQIEGIAAAKAAGKYKGRKPTAMAKADEIAALKAQGLGASEIAAQVGVSRASVYRALAS